MFGSKRKKIASLEQVVAALQLQVDQLTAHLRALGGLEHFQLRQEIDRMRAELVDLQHAHAAELLAHQQSLAQL
ncbi:hypothetical protein LFM09_01570 [Lentzea alba]|uniref:hypothetical protein n=1 Tax=Lentzea alba TaxID=2714351 RepID=UPI0039BFD189